MNNCQEDKNDTELCEGGKDRSVSVETFPLADIGVPGLQFVNPALIAIFGTFSLIAPFGEEMFLAKHLG